MYTLATDDLQRWKLDDKRKNMHCINCYIASAVTVINVTKLLCFFGSDFVYT